MAHKPIIGQNFAPSKATLKGISPQTITHVRLSQRAVHIL